MVAAAHQGPDPTKVNLAYALSPQAIATVVGRTSRISSNNSEDQLAAIRWWKIARLPSLLSDGRHIGDDKSGYGYNEAS
jgi:hypothetical protein